MASTPTHIAKWVLLTALIIKLLGFTLGAWAWIICAVSGILGGWPDIAAFPDHIRAMLAARRRKEADWYNSRNYDGQYTHWHFGGALYNKIGKWIPQVRDHAEIDRPMHNQFFPYGWSPGAGWIEKDLIIMVIVMILLLRG